LIVIATCSPSAVRILFNLPANGVITVVTRRLPLKETNKNNYLDSARTDQEHTYGGNHQARCRQTPRPCRSSQGQAGHEGCASGEGHANEEGRSRTSRYQSRQGHRPAETARRRHTEKPHESDWLAGAFGERGFLSGALGKKLRTPVESFKSDAGERAYRLSSK